MRGFGRNFLLLWHGQVISQLGNQTFLIAAAYLTLDATNSTSLVATVMMASTVPLVVIGPIGGTIADRHSRRRIIVVTDLVRGLSIGAFAAFTWLGGPISSIHVALLLVVAVANGVMAAAFTPALQALVPDLVQTERLASANSLTQFSNQLAVLLGQALGGILYLRLGATALFTFDALTFGYAALATSWVASEQRQVSRELTLTANLKRYVAETAVGLAYLRTQPAMMHVVLTFAAVNFLFMPVFVLLPLYVQTELHASADWYGFLLAGAGGGALAGAAIAGFVFERGSPHTRAVLPGIVTIASATFILAATQTAAVALAAFVAIGLAATVINIAVVTSIQMRVPSDVRGRVMALVVALSAAATPFGMAIGGLMGDLWRESLRAVFGACAVALVLIAAIGARSLQAFQARRIPETLTPP